MYVGVYKPIGRDTTYHTVSFDQCPWITAARRADIGRSRSEVVLAGRRVFSRMIRRGSYKCRYVYIQQVGLRSQSVSAHNGSIVTQIEVGPVQRKTILRCIFQEIHDFKQCS